MAYLGVLPELRNNDLGAALGTGIGKALEGLTKGKIQRIKNQQMERDLLESGLPPQYAKLLTTLQSNQEGQKAFWNGLDFNQLLGQENQEENPLWTGKANDKAFEQELKREKLDLQKEQERSKQQEAINKKYDKTIKDYEKDYQLGVQIEQLADEMDKLNDEIEEEWSPWAESASQGIKGLSYGLVNAPALAGNKAEVFRTKANEVVDLTSNAIKGLASKYRVGIKEASKPSLNQSYEARKHNISDLRKRAKILQIPYANANEILQANEGNIPKTFGQEVLPRIKEQIESLYKGKEKKVIDTFMLKELGKPEEGIEFKDTDTDTIYFVKNGAWYERTF